MGIALFIGILLIVLVSIFWKASKETADPDKKTKYLNQETVINDGYVAPSDDGTPDIIRELRNAYKGQSLTKLNDLYFNLCEKIVEAEARHDYTKMLMHCQLSFGLIEPLIICTKKEIGKFDLKSIPAIDKALIYFAINGNSGQLKNIEDIVEYFVELHFYKEKVIEAFHMLETAAKIYKLVKTNPNTIQSDLKKQLNVEDGKFVARTVHYMENLNKIKKSKVGSKIYLIVKN
mgnify:CR=1 FL=1